MRRAAILSILASGCFSPHYSSGSWTCGPGNDCPAGFHCGAEGTCVNGNPIGPQPDGGGARPDGQAPFPDAPPGDHLLTITLAGDDGTSANVTIYDQNDNELGQCAQPSCAYALPASTVVTLAAQATTAAVMFEEFDGDCTGGGCQLSMSADHSVTATFSPVLENLTIYTGGASSVDVSPIGMTCTGDCTYQIPYGTNVDLTPVPAAGFQVAPSTGPCIDFPCDFPIQSDETETVSFIGGGVEASAQLSATGAWSEAWVIAVDPTTDYVWVGGSFQAQIDLGDGSSPHASQGRGDIFLIALSSDGNVVWGHTFGGTGDDHAEALVWNPSTAQMDLLVSTTSDATFGSVSEAEQFDAGIASTYDVVLSSDGTVQAVYPIFEGQVNSATVDGAGQVIFGGEYYGVSHWGVGSNYLPTYGDGAGEGIIGFITPSGAAGGHSQIVAPGDDRVNQITWDAETGELVAGGTFGGDEPFLDMNTAGGVDAFYAVMDESANISDKGSVGSAANDFGTGVVRDGSTGHILLLGTVASTTQFAGTTLNGGDAFLADFVNGAGSYGLDLGPAAASPDATYFNGGTYGITYTDYDEVLAGNFEASASLMKTFINGGAVDTVVWNLDEIGNTNGLYLPAVTPDNQDMGGVWAAGWTTSNQSFQGVTVAAPNGAGSEIVVLHVGP